MRGIPGLSPDNFRFFILFISNLYLYHIRQEVFYLERILALLADGTDYTAELASYFKTRKDFFFKPVLFNDINELNRFSKEFTVDLLLCDEVNENDIPSSYDNVCFLCEDSEVMEAADTEAARWHRIFKYQSSEKIIRDIVEYYKRKQQKTAEELKAVVAKKRIVSVCSPVGGSYASTFALALAGYYSIGGKTLFISFDPFFQYPGEDKNRADKNLTDLIYYMEVSVSGLDEFVSRMAVRRGSLDYVSGVSHWFDISDMSRTKMRALMESLNNTDRYENIVFDLRITGDAGIELLAGSKNIYVTKKPGAQAARAVEEWKRQIRFANFENILEKTREIEVPYDELLAGEYSFEVLLKGHLGQFIEEMEGLRYSR